MKAGYLRSYMMLISLQILQILDYDQIDKIANAICDFVGANDGVEFPNWRSN